MKKIRVEDKLKHELLEIRNKYGFLNMSRTIKYLIKLEKDSEIIKGIVKDAIDEVVNEPVEDAVVVEEPEEEIIEPEKIQTTIEQVQQDIQKLAKEPVQETFQEPVEPIKKEPEKIDTENIKKVVCPKCDHNFFADVSRNVVCPKCGLVGKSSK